MGKLTALVLIALMASAATAGINTDDPLGPLVLAIYADETGKIINSGSEPFMFDTYSIQSFGMRPVDITGIYDNTMLDILGFPPRLGMTPAEALQWREMGGGGYTEFTFGKGATLQPGDSIDLGAAFYAVDQEGSTFTYYSTMAPAGYQRFEGAIIPEPATMSLLGFGVLALFGRRR